MSTCKYHALIRKNHNLVYQENIGFWDQFSVIQKNYANNIIYFILSAGFCGVGEENRGKRQEQENPPLSSIEFIPAQTADRDGGGNIEAINQGKMQYMGQVDVGDSSKKGIFWRVGGKETVETDKVPFQPLPLPCLI